MSTDDLVSRWEQRARRGYATSVSGADTCIDDALVEALRPLAVRARRGRRGQRRVLELGCGAGAFTRVLQRAGFDHGLAVDVAPTMLEAWRAANTAPGWTDLQADWCALGAGSTPVDIVAARLVLRHSPWPLADTLRSWLPLGVPGAPVVVVEALPPAEAGPGLALYEAAMALRGKRRTFTAGELLSAAASTGAEDVRLQTFWSPGSLVEWATGQANTDDERDALIALYRKGFEDPDARRAYRLGDGDHLPVMWRWGLLTLRRSHG